MFRAVTRFVRRRQTSMAFSSEVPKDAEQGKSNILKEQEKKFDVPVHLRPYDAKKYEVTSNKLKPNPGFALMEIEPFPRARIMRLCYNLLEKLRQIPETAMYRMLTEEKVKYIMKIVDEEEDIPALEKALGTEAIELFIQQLADQFELFEYLKVDQPWVKKPISRQELEWIYDVPVDSKNPRYIRDPRIPKRFAEGILEENKG